MNIYFWLGLLIPIMASGLIFGATSYFLRQNNKITFNWVVASSIFNLFFVLSLWVLISQYLNSVQCKAAYGDLSSDPKICNTPASGFAAMLQLPVIIISWSLISGYVIYKFKLHKGK